MNVCGLVLGQPKSNSPDKSNSLVFIDRVYKYIPNESDEQANNAYNNNSYYCIIFVIVNISLIYFDNRYEMDERYNTLQYFYVVIDEYFDIK